MTSATPTIAEAIDLFNRQAFFECHEVLEDLWRPLPPGPEKMFLQGLLQVGVGYYHWQRGNFTGARNKLSSGLEKLETVASQKGYAAPVTLLPLIQQVQTALHSPIEQGADNMPPCPATPRLTLL